MKKRTLLSVFGIIVALILLSLGIYDMVKPVGDVSEECFYKGGTWLEEYNECEFISEEDCISLKGKYTECGSACRHDLTAEYCILSCVPYCKF